MIAIFIKELKTTFLTGKMLLLLGIFTFLSGFIFLSLIEQFNPLVQRAALVPGAPVSLNERVTTPHLSGIRILLLFFVPLLTMKSIAGEREQKTLPLLLVSPVSSQGIILGKFFALTVAVSLFVLLQLFFPLALASVAVVEIAPVLVGISGLILLSALYISVGIAISAFSNSQVVSGVLTFLTLFLLHSSEAFVPEFGGKFASFFRLFSPNIHLEFLLQGVLKSSSLCFFFGLSATLLVVAHERLDLERGA